MQRSKRIPGRSSQRSRLQEIEQWNQQWLSRKPEGEGLEYFTTLRDSIDPSRTDIVTWADVLDLDEKREVPRRSPVPA